VERSSCCQLGRLRMPTTTSHAATLPQSPSSRSAPTRPRQTKPSRAPDWTKRAHDKTFALNWLRRFGPSGASPVGPAGTAKRSHTPMPPIPRATRSLGCGKKRQEVVAQSPSTVHPALSLANRGPLGYGYTPHTADLVMDPAGAAAGRGWTILAVLPIMGAVDSRWQRGKLECRSRGR